MTKRPPLLKPLRQLILPPRKALQRDPEVPTDAKKMQIWILGEGDWRKIAAFVDHSDRAGDRWCARKMVMVVRAVSRGEGRWSAWRWTNEGGRMMDEGTFSSAEEETTPRNWLIMGTIVGALIKGAFKGRTGDGAHHLCLPFFCWVLFLIKIYLSFLFRASWSGKPGINVYY